MQTSNVALPSQSQPIPLPFLIAAFCLLWSSAFAVAKVGMADSPPLLLLVMRFLGAGILIFGVATIRRSPWNLSRRDVLVFAVLGVVNQATFLGLGYVGMHSISSGLSALVVSANPVLTAVMAAWFLNERMTWRKAAGLLLGVIGVAFVVESRIAGGVDPSVGIAFTIAALFSLVGGTIFFKKFAPAHGHWIGNGVQSSIGRADHVALRADIRKCRRHRAERAPACGRCLSRHIRLGVRLSALVPHAHGVGRDRGEFLSLHDAAARIAVRLASARRACRAHRCRRHCAGCPRHLSRHSSTVVTKLSIDARSKIRCPRCEPPHHRKPCPACYPIQSSWPVTKYLQLAVR